MHWVFLLLAVLVEVAGTLGMKLLVSAGHPAGGALVAAGMVGVAYGLLSQATGRIPIAIANALWEGLGMLLIALVSVALLREPITSRQGLALMLAVLGIALTQYGSARQAGEA